MGDQVQHPFKAEGMITTHSPLTGCETEKVSTWTSQVSSENAAAKTFILKTSAVPTHKSTYLHNPQEGNRPLPLLSELRKLLYQKCGDDVWSLVGGYQSFEGTCCLHTQVYAKYGGSMLLWNLMVHHIIRCHERDDKNTNFHHFRNLESYTGKK